MQRGYYLRETLGKFHFGFCLGVILVVLGLSNSGLRAAENSSIQGVDAFGKSVTVNATGHYTLVIYTNPDLEDDTRKVTMALDGYRGRSNFKLVRVVDLRGDVPPSFRSEVRNQIRDEVEMESTRLKKKGVDSARAAAPVIPDFSGSTLNALGWDNTYDKVRVVIFDPQGHEVKRISEVAAPSDVTRAVDALL